MSSTKFDYPENRRQVHFMLAGTCLFMGMIGLFKLWDYSTTLENRVGEMKVNADNFALLVALLLAPIPLLLEWLYIRNGFLLNKPSRIIVIVLASVLLVTVHEGAVFYYTPYFESKGWKKCREYTTHGSAGRYGSSSRRIEIWRPQGKCP